MPKLTLSADQEVIERAKQLAQERGTSVSALFSRFIDALASEAALPRRELGPLTRKAMGLVQLPSDQTDRQLIEAALSKRFGK